ncbi:tetratricopeptide repeat protein [Phytohabitans rumicis]|uniref:Tetratricopeptide repeat protein n=1 Tax=Phytohabitans rumicis TaxID=1076125 RepID=A0A6V8LGE2_9ACTN|nr:tetratricopeptide repeat protein [Phytohabitans rumicis]GFJ95324.1 hypothetical protein Prum_089660 [Phytohabitans rumicis]
MTARWLRQRLVPAWWVATCALAVAAPAVVAAFGVTRPPILGAAAVVAALATALAGNAQQLHARTSERAERRRLAMREGLLIDRRGRPPQVRDIRDATVLGVHPAISDASAGRTNKVPAYVPREIDDRLRARLREGGFVLLVGDSSSGKSRTAVEAMSAVLPDHVLISPLTRTAVPAAVETAGRARRCVVWLDDLEQYLGADGLTRARLLQVVAWPDPDRLVLATMRAAEYARVIDPAGDERDERASREQAEDARAVLALAETIPLARIFTATELRTPIIKAGDPRLADALRHANRYGVAEYLAAGPECLTLWSNGWAAGVHPRGAALVAAAVDARRAGVTAPLPRTLLDQVHEHYLDRRGGATLRPEVPAAAWEWATRPRRGTTGLLVPNPRVVDGVDVFDYLVDSVERNARATDRIPDELLSALLLVADPAELTRVAGTAFEAGHENTALRAHRGAYERRLAELGPDHPDTVASQHSVAYALTRVGQPDAARPIWQELVATYTRMSETDQVWALRARQGLANTLPPASAAVELAHLYEEFRRAIGPDDRLSLACRSDLAGALSAAGRHDEARTVFDALLDDLRRVPGHWYNGPVGARHQIAYVLTSLGRLDEAEPLWEEVVAAYLDERGVDHPLTLRARQGIAWVVLERGRLPAARELLAPLLGDYQRVLGPEHPWTASCVEMLALTRR